jgi:membrane-associated protein
MFDALLELISASPWTYAVVFAVAALDAIVPAVPSETTVISAGVLAGSGDLSISLVAAAAAVGALLGDNTSYAIGRMLGPRLDERIARSEKAIRRRGWAERKLQARGGVVLFLARFVPGGRTATTLTAGVVRFRWTRFLVLTALAGTAWAATGALLGYAGGRAFEDHAVAGLSIVLVPLAITYLALEAVRRARRRRHAPADAASGLAMPRIRVRRSAPRLPT